MARSELGPGSFGFCFGRRSLKLLGFYATYLYECEFNRGAVRNAVDCIRGARQCERRLSCGDTLLTRLTRWRVTFTLFAGYIAPGAGTYKTSMTMVA